MINMNLSALIAALDNTCREALEDAAQGCVSRGGHEIGIEDYMESLLHTDYMRDILEQYELSADRIRELLEKGRKNGGSVSGRPVFSSLLIEFLQEAYLLASLELKQERVDVGVLSLTLLLNPARYSIMPFYQEFGRIPADNLRRLIEGSQYENSSYKAAKKNDSGSGGESALQKYTVNYIEEAKSGRIDPVFARGPEVRQIVDILTRRRKNNPILVGDPGVGKTAVVEGLALRVVAEDVPDALKGVHIVGLDMGRLQAGASVKGEFEKRLKAVIDEVKAAPVPTILFIDEAHTLVGSGNAAGGSDGANLLKPALARGELRTLAATTWGEYKKYFEKDAALARRFQLVKLGEPSVEETITILRGIVPHYEKSHKVYVRDDALVKAAELSARYISERYMPDKAIDVLDTACARVKVSLGAKPGVLEELEEQQASLLREVNSLERDLCRGAASGMGTESAVRHIELKAALAELGGRIIELEQRWQKEKVLAEEVMSLRAKIAEKTLPDTDKIETFAKDIQDGVNGAAIKDTEKQSSQPSLQSFEPNSHKLETLLEQLRNLQGENPLVFYEVCPALIAEIVAEWTGVPVGRLSGDETSSLQKLGARIKQRIKGQDHAVRTIEKAVLSSRAGLNNPNMPSGIFLLVGPSGVGKTETALALAEELFGGERFLISINMSEFQEKHTVSRLIGSPPGYVGYGEGGRLTEAVRRQPYSAVLFDEVEKAHPDVLNLFYQMFDKGVLADGEGREIDFRNTLIFMTSNLGADIITALCENTDFPSPEELYDALRPTLAHFFKPALLGRMTVVPYTTIPSDILKELAIIKLNKIAERLRFRYRLSLTWAEEVTENIIKSCIAVDSGARNIDHVINANILPEIAAVMLSTLSGEGRAPEGMYIALDAEAGRFTYTLSYGC